MKTYVVWKTLNAIEQAERDGIAYENDIFGVFTSMKAAVQFCAEAEPVLPVDGSDYCIQSWNGRERGFWFDRYGSEYDE